MLDNHIYDLVNQLAQEHKSLWRIKRMYKEDSRECKDCLDFWESLEKEKEKEIEELKALIKTHLN